MTLAELEILVNQIKRQVDLNTLSIKSLSNRLNEYTPIGSFYAVNAKVDTIDTTITKIRQDVAKLSLDLSTVNKLSSMLDTNISSAIKGDILQYDGDRWTNIKPAGIVGSSGVSKLEDLTDVRIQNKLDKQAICWDNVSSKWVNYTIPTGGGDGGTDLDIAAMWAELAKVDTTKKIDKSHINGFVSTVNGTAQNLTVTGALSASGNISLNNGTVYLNILNNGVSINGNMVATGEVSAYKLA